MTSASYVRRENEYGVILELGDYKVGYTYDGFIDFGGEDAMSVDEAEAKLPMLEVLLEELKDIIKSGKKA